MKPFELREFSADELKQKLHDLHEEFMSIRFKKQAETPKPSDIKKIKREIARIKTILREKEITGDKK
ncbi:MAG: 50S ribosomal protein L29 [bacterium (Candidatus Stahlbacteria) CG08_land_8_20_14_0_20_40_26]|nr:50S ribosomal protein L29 [candidate division WOR-3 bacterium]PIP11867.1 MAG: 50S ribosomal protein L29 [bacterium (Candidatus Stahlbacteria) CG23_combo_of_CG06-09_8_20_14_all_40_9]PIS26847.1 MAG: 50S ribosomal protein L29 [bacterium (Candidatus Stahlbacteria) CG08_land_8_20_14_0_20_40_26]